MSSQRKTQTYIKGIKNCINGEPFSLYNIKNNGMRIGYFAYMAFETSVAQSRNYVLEYAMTNINILQQIF